MSLFSENSKIKGCGVFTTDSIRAGTPIYKLSGDIVDLAEIKKRQKAGIESSDDPLQIGDNLYIDLDNFSRLFNHSCDPNAGIRNECDLVAIKEILKGEEITFDYSTTVPMDKDWWKMPCSCGALQCRKVVSSISSVPLKSILYYQNLKVLPLYMENQLSMAGLKKIS